MTPGFSHLIAQLTGNLPFPWQRKLYEPSVGQVEVGIPLSCNIPTGLGKTSVVAVWLLALAAKPELVPRRLVCVANRRTVVDQTTDEVRRYIKALDENQDLQLVRASLLNLWAIPISLNPMQASPLEVSTLRGQCRTHAVSVSTLS